MIGSHVIPLAIGVNLVEKIVEIALNNEVLWDPIKNRGAAITRIHANKNGILKSIDISEVEKMQNVRYVRIFTEPGTRVQIPKSNGDFLGYIIVEGKDAQEAKELAYNAYKAYKVNLE